MCALLLAIGCSDTQCRAPHIAKHLCPSQVCAAQGRLAGSLSLPAALAGQYLMCGALLCRHCNRQAAGSQGGGGGGRFERLGMVAREEVLVVKVGWAGKRSMGVQGTVGRGWSSWKGGRMVAAALCACQQGKV